MKNLEGRVALVTGAAHRVGRSIAMALASDGADVLVHYGRSTEAADETVGAIRALGRKAWAVSADLRKPEAVETLFEQFDTHFDRLDILVNSAASFKKQGFSKIGLEDWEASMSVNLRAPFLMSQAAAPRIRESARGVDEPGLIVNICDLSGLHPWHGYVQHGVSKAGLLHLTKILARELAPEIRANAILPGAILPPPDLSPESDLWREIGSASPMGRPGSPEKIGEAVCFLARADYITGAVLPVDGGEHLMGPINH